MDSSLRPPTHNYLCVSYAINEAMKPSRLRDHLQRMHADKKDKPLNYFKSLKEQFENRKTIATMFNTGKISDNHAGMIASYRIAALIAKNGKPHNIGESLLHPVIAEVINTVMHRNAAPILKSIPLSPQSMKRRIDEMAQDVKEQLTDILRTRNFSLQLDESTVSDSRCLLMAYVRYFDDDCQPHEEMLFIDQLLTGSKGESIFNSVLAFFTENRIPFANLLSFATDGAPAMVGRYKGCIAHLRKEAPHALAIHCIIHRQHLVAKNLNLVLHQALMTAVHVINKVKLSGKSERLFRQLCVENDEQFERLLMHTEVRWLSKGNCLTRLVELHSTVSMFLEQQNLHQLKTDFQSSKNDIFYLAAFYQLINNVNLQLQGQYVTLIECRQVVSTLIDKLKLIGQNLLRRDFHQLPQLANISESVTDKNIEMYAAHLTVVSDDLKCRFHDILTMTIPDWIFNPFDFDVSTAESDQQDNLLVLRNDCEAQVSHKQKGFKAMWMRPTVAASYPRLWSKVEFLLLAFPTSYLVESGFSRVNMMLTKSRNRLDITDRGDIRMALTKLTPNVEKLVEQHQPQGSH